MNKSKFLKKSLAALLAILMVVAMIPLSAAAEEAPAPEGPKAPTITVNNATATAPTEEGGAYTATVRDATTVSVSWINAEEGYSAWILTERGVSVAVPFRALDLLTEGKPLDTDADGNVTYQVKFELKKADATAQDEAIKSYDLNIKVLASVPNDDTTIKLVRPNQEFRLDNVQHKFIGIDSEVDNENNVITITLPLGIPYYQAGFDDGRSTGFGHVNGSVNGVRWPGTSINGSSVAQINKNNAVARRVFVPNSVYSTVRYTAPTGNNKSGTLTVTSRDGHSRNYTVNFVQEDALNNVSVTGVDSNGNTYGPYSNAVQSVDNTGIVTFTLGVGGDLAKADYWIVSYGQGNNVVRVEDPILNDGSYADPYETWTAGNINGQGHKDNPVRSGQNKIKFVANGETKYAYLTVKTQANMAPNTEQMGVSGPDLEADGIVDGNFFQDVKIVLRKSASVANTDAYLTELQLNGYQAIWNNGKPLELDEDGEIKVYVDYDFEFSTGDGQHPARLSGTVKGTHVSIPAQDSSLVQDDYWGVGKQAVDTNGRITKPSTPKFALDNVNTEDGKVTLRVWNGSDYTDYPIHIIKGSNFDTKVSGVHLYEKQSDGTYKLAYNATSSTGKNWQFKLPDNLYANSNVSAGAASTLTSANFPKPNNKPLYGTQPTTTIAGFAGTTYQFDMFWNDNTDVQYQDAIKEVLEQKIADGALGADRFGDPYKVDENATNKSNADLYLVESDEAGEVNLVARVAVVSKNVTTPVYVDVVIATGVFSSSAAAQALGLPEVKDQIIFYTPNGTSLATGKFTKAGNPHPTATPASTTMAAGAVALADPAAVAADGTATPARAAITAAFSLTPEVGGNTAKADAITEQITDKVNEAVEGADLDGLTVTVETYLKKVTNPELKLQWRGKIKFTRTSGGADVPAADVLTSANLSKADFLIAESAEIENEATTPTAAITRPLLIGSENVATVTFTSTTVSNTEKIADLLANAGNTWSNSDANAISFATTPFTYHPYIPASPRVPVSGRASWLGSIQGLSPENPTTGSRTDLYSVNVTSAAETAAGKTNTLELYGEFNPGPNAGSAIADALYNLTTGNAPTLTADELRKATTVQLFAKLTGDARAPKFELYAKLTGSAPADNKIATVDAPVVFTNGKASVSFGEIGTLDFTAVNHITGTGGPSWSYMANSDPLNVFFTLIGTNAKGLGGSAVVGAFKQTIGSVISGTYTIPGTDGTLAKVLAGLRVVPTGIEVIDQVRYTGSGSSESILNKKLQDFLLVIDTPQGAVVTPGGASKNGRAITEQVGVSMWNNGNGFNEGWPTGNVYTELEKGVTTLGSWWLADTTSNTNPAANNVYDYTRNAANNGAGAGRNTDTLYFTVKNGYDGPESVYTITLAGTTNTTYPSIADELIVSGAIATSAIDEDLVYGGNSVTNAILVRNGALCALPSINNGIVSNKFSASSTSFGGATPPANPGWINPANAAYINDIGGNNLYSNIKVEALTDEKNASVVTITVPEDFGTGTYGWTNAPNSLFFSGLSAASGATVYRLISEGTVTESDNEMKPFNLDMKNQNQQGNITDEFSDNLEFIFRSSNQVFDNGSGNSSGGNRQDMSAWSANGQFDSSKVSRDNIIYVVSADAKRASSFPQIVNERNIDTLSNVHNAHKYYITVRREGKNVADELIEMKAEENTSINVTSNNSLKTLELHVPATYDWAGYRDNASKDFQLNFNLSDGALLIDAYRDPAFGFKNNKNTSPSLYADFSLTDLTKEMQEVARWTSAGEDAVNPTTFFVKNGELYMINPNTGIETQITGMGDEVNDYFIDSRWSQIMAKEAELRVYNEARNQVNTYKLKLVIDPVTSVAEITHLTVDESTAVVDNETRKATVKLPSDTDLEAVKLSIAVSPQARIISIAGEDYDPTDKEATYNITEGINIVIEAGDGATYTYTLTVDGTNVEPADATITKLTVDGVEAEVNNTARTAAVELPEGSDLSKVKLAIEVSEGDKLVSVAGEEFDAEAEYDLSSPIAIVIEAEDGTKYDYTLTGTVAKPVDPVNPADKYTDLDKIQKEETRDEVKKAINLGLMNGISESKGIFGVGMKMQRFQFALVVARADLREKLLAEDENADVTVNALDAKLVELYPDNYTFTDVSEKIELKAAAAAVQYCYDKGYINGKSLANKIFDPTGNITREEAAKIMVLWAGLEHEDTDVSAIPDGDQISNWAKGYVKAAADAGIMKGRTDGNFDPKGDLQRQDGACLLVRTYENYIVKADEDETPDDGDDDNDDNNNGDDDTNTPGDDDENNGGDTSKPDDDTSSTPEDGDDNSSSTPDGEDDNSSSTPDEDNESQPAE